MVLFFISSFLSRCQTQIDSHLVTIYSTPMHADKHFLLSISQSTLYSPPIPNFFSIIKSHELFKLKEKFSSSSQMLLFLVLIINKNDW